MEADPPGALARPWAPPTQLVAGMGREDSDEHEVKVDGPVDVVDAFRNAILAIGK